MPGGNASSKWRIENRGPRFLKIGPLVRYRPQDIEQWLAALPVGGTRALSQAL